MALYLVQHGKSLPKNIDPNQGLSKEGIEETNRIADVARGYQVDITGIIHSVKKRARQTSELFSEKLKPEAGVEEKSGLKPMDDVRAFAKTIKDRDNTMFVGHLPFMEKLVSYLITGSIDHTVFKFQNSGIVCLDQNPDTGSWVIKWTLMPNI